MVYKESAGCFRRCAGVEGAAVGSEDRRNVFVEVAHFAHYGARELRGVGWEMGEGEGAFGVLDLGGLEMLFSRKMWLL